MANLIIERLSTPTISDLDFAEKEGKVEVCLILRINSIKDTRENGKLFELNKTLEEVCYELNLILSRWS